MTSQHFQDLAQFQGDLSQIRTHGPNTTPRHPSETAQHSQYGRTEYHYSTAACGHSFSQTLQSHHETRTQRATEPPRYECNGPMLSSHRPVHPRYPPKYYKRKPDWMPYYLWQTILRDQQWATEHMYDLQWETVCPERKHVPNEAYERPPRTSPLRDLPLSMPPPPLPRHTGRNDHAEPPLAPAPNPEAHRPHGDYATTAGGSPNEEADTHAISMLIPLDRPEEYSLTDPWADQFGSSNCPCGGRLFSICAPSHATSAPHGTSAWEETRAAERKPKLERNGACAPSRINFKRNGLGAAGISA